MDLAELLQQSLLTANNSVPVLEGTFSFFLKEIMNVVTPKYTANVD